MKTHKLLFWMTVATLMTCGPRAALAQGTAFSYQGRLNNNGAPATGLYDLQFTLFDAPGAGVQQGSVLTLNSQGVTNGLFFVTLDFGNQFPGAARWLQIAVRTNGGAVFTPLAPRQPISPSPYAIFAGGVNASTISGTIPAANIGSGTITSNMLAAGAAAANLASSGQSAVPSGGLILSATENPALTSAGYVRIGSVQGGDAWQERSVMPPSSRYLHTAIWTGTEMIVMGGTSGTSAL